MRKILIILLALIILPVFAENPDVQKSDHAANVFTKDLATVKDNLKQGKMSPAQAAILLQAIQARQLNVIIHQNAAIINLLSERK